MKNFLFYGLVFLMSTPAFAKTETVHYKDGETELEGYLSYTGSPTKKRPTVLIVHEWKGLGDYEKRRADQIAKLGYLAFAIDVYGKGVRAKDDKEAGELAKKYKGDLPLLRARTKAALDFIQKHPLFQPKKVAAIGYCFGGTSVLEMARAGNDLNGVVSFHGGLDTKMPATAETLKAKILVLNGADDTYVPQKVVDAFTAEMRKAKADWQMVNYGNAVHGFSKPEAGNDVASNYAYNKVADMRSFQAMVDFLKEIF